MKQTANTSTINTLGDVILEKIPGEAFFLKCLQKQMRLIINEKTIKEGRLLLFKRSHFYIHIVMNTKRNPTESFEIPFPFGTEIYSDDNLMYFDYRISSLNIQRPIGIPSKTSSTYFNKILEISCAD